MIGMGAFTLATGLAAAFLVFSGPGELPPLLYGRLRKPEPAPIPIIRRPRSSLVSWKEWSKDSLDEAKRKDRLILLNMRWFGSRACRVMDETTYADPATAEFIAKNFIPVRVDGDQRPDLALRYFSGRPTTALLLPTGEILDSGSSMPAPLFLKWAQTLEPAFRKNRVKVMEAAHQALEKRRELAMETFAREEKARSSERKAEVQVKPTLSEDPVWGGYFHSALGSRGIKEYEKRLEDQAAALADLAHRDPEAAQRTMAYVSLFLCDPQGGYYAGQAGELTRDNTIIEGEYYFSLPNKKRWALGFPLADTRIFAAANGRMAAAVLRASEIGEPGRAHALKTLDRFWQEGITAGTVKHELGGEVTIFLDDQIAMAKAYLAAYSATGRRRDLDRASAIIAATEEWLWNKQAQAFYDRPALGELPEGLDRLLVPSLNREALLLKGAD